MKKFIKIYGERNTNSRYLSRLIHLNLEVEELPGTIPKFFADLQYILPGKEWIRNSFFQVTTHRNLGWKHMCPRPADELAEHRLIQKGAAVVTITKNPYAWLLSLHRRPYQQYHSKQLTFEEFLKTPWIPAARENLDRGLSSPVELWNVKNKAYKQLRSIGAMNLTSEGILTSPEQTIDQIAEEFSLSRKSGTFINYQQSTKGDQKDTEFYQDYYLNERWRSELSPAAIRTINHALDKPLLKSFGYALLPES